MCYSCAPFGGRNVPYSHSLLRYIRRALLKFGERTLTTTGSHDFTDGDFFPYLDNDMGDNLNANGAAPVAPYVFLSFLFEIVVEFMFLLCNLLDPICSSTMLLHMISLISVISVMINFVLIWIKSCSNCWGT